MNVTSSASRAKAVAAISASASPTPWQIDHRSMALPYAIF